MVERDSGRYARRIVDRWALLFTLLGFGSAAVGTAWGWEGVLIVTLFGTLTGIIIGWVIAGRYLRRYDSWMREIGHYR